MFVCVFEFLCDEYCYFGFFGCFFFVVIIDILIVLQLNGWVYFGDFWFDFGWYFWSLFIVLVIVILVWMMGWCLIFGVLFVGFFGVLSLLLLVGSLVVSVFGFFDDWVVVFWVLFIEELFKVLFVVFFVLLVLCNCCCCLVVFDFGVLGFVLGIGFVLIENVDFGCVDGLWDVVFLLFVFFLLMFIQGVGDQLQVVVGYVVWFGFIGLVIGFGVFYLCWWCFVWIVIFVVFVVSFVEYVFINVSELLVFVVELMVDGMLFFFFFLIGMIVLVCFEY